MSSPAKKYAIGWDVGGWNCTHNANSRDAIAILDDDAKLVGRVWRGNLASAIHLAKNANEWLVSLFDLCDAPSTDNTVRAAIGIDTPLAFSAEFVSLLGGYAVESLGAASSQNQYLYRFTERRLAAKGRTPLSPVKDMIGSQATKGMHALARFTPVKKDVGVWADRSDYLLAFETYPTVCRDHPLVKRIVANSPPQDNNDKQDALVCAAVARLFLDDLSSLEQPLSEAPSAEGWIWRPIPDAAEL